MFKKSQHQSIDHPFSDRKESVYLFVIFIFLGLVFLSVVMATYFIEYKRYQTEKESELTAIAISKIEAISLWRTERLADGARTWNNPIIYEKVNDLLSNPQDVLIQQEIYRWLVNIRAANDYDSFFLVDSTNKIIMRDVNYPEDLNTFDYSLVTQTFQEDQVILSNLEVSQDSRMIYMDLAIPISNGNQPPIAVVILRIDPNKSFYKMVSSWPINSKTGDMVLFRVEDNNILFLNNPRFLENAALNSKFSISTSNIAAVKISQGYFEPFYSIDYRGKQVMAVGRQIPGTNWYLLAKIDKEEIFVDIQHEGWLIGLLLIVILSLIYFLGFSQIRRQRQNMVNELITADLEHQIIQQKYGLVFDQSNDSVFVLSESGKILEANDRASLAYGYSHDELLQKEAKDLVAPDEKEMTSAIREEVKTLGGMHYERHHQRKDGTIFPVDISSRYYQENGRGYFLNFIHDISDKSRNLELLKKSEEKYRNLVEHSVDAIIVANSFGEFLDVNEQACRMLGYTREEFDKIKVVDLVDPESLKQTPLKIKEIAGDESRSIILERILVRKDRTRIPVEILAYGLSEGRLQVIIKDITERVNYIQKIKEAAENYQSLFDANPIPFYVYDQETRYFLAVNDEALRQYGYSRGEFLSMKLEDVVHSSQLQIDVDKNETRSSIKHVRKSGEIFEVEIISHPIRFGDHKAVIERSLDVTEKVNTEKELKENLSKLQGIINTSPLAVISTDMDGKVTLFNKAAETIFGWKSEEIIGKEYPMLDGSSGETVRSVVDRIIASKGSIHYEARRLRKDGTPIIADIYATPIKDYLGNYNGLLALIEDITESKLAAEANQKLSEERDQLLKRMQIQFERMPIGYILADRNLNVLDWNPQAEKIFGYSREEILGKNQYDLIIPPERHEEVKEVIKKAEQQNETTVYPHENITKDGRRIMVEWHDTSLYDDQGNFVAIMNMAIDVTARIEAERKVKESAEKLTAFFESPLVGILYANLTGNIHNANDEFLKIIGYTRTELEAGQIQWTKLTPPEFLPLDNAAIKEAKVNGVCTPYEKQYFRKDGQRIWVMIGFVLSRLESQETIAYVLDISDRKQMEEALIESEANYRGLFTHMSTGMAFCRMIYEKDNPIDYEILRVNEAFIKMTGLKGAAGKKISELIPDFIDSNPEMIESYGKIARDGGQVQMEAFIPQLGLYLSTFAYSPKKDHFVVLLEDITEKKKTETEIQNSQELLKMTGRVGKIGGWELDTITNTMSWTETTTEINDLDPTTQPTNELATRYFTPESRLKIHRAIEDAKTSGNSYDMELNLISAKGIHKIVRDVGIPEMENGRVVRIKGILQDITEMKQAEAEILKLNEELEQRVKSRTSELEIANKELESFSYSVSHDLRAPIRAIDGFSQIILDEYKDQVDPEIVRYLEIIRKNTENMGNLVDDLLAFSRLGRHALQKTTLNTKNLVKEVVESVQIDTKGRKIDFKIGKLPDCKADYTLLRQVYVNLISNAVKFTRKCENARIEIGYEQCKPTDKVAVENLPKYCYYVRDNGIGFDMRFYDKLFGVFQRLHKPEEYEGTGVGLAIVKRIIEKHGGEVWAESKLNEGTTFYFVLGENGSDDESN
jgi:PAS domain S-box-containing protein